MAWATRPSRRRQRDKAEMRIIGAVVEVVKVLGGLVLLEVMLR